jgi:hypothetical protein
MTAPELREALAEIRAQVDDEAAVLEELAEAILAGDLDTTTAVLTHLRDLFMVISALLRCVDVAEAPSA